MTLRNTEVPARNLEDWAAIKEKNVSGDRCNVTSSRLAMTVFDFTAGIP